MSCGTFFSPLLLEVILNKIIVYFFYLANDATIFIIDAMVGQIDVTRCMQNIPENNAMVVAHDCDELITATEIVKQRLLF